MLATLPLLALWGCMSRAPEPAPPAPPKILLFVVVDQLPTRLLDDARPLLTGGLARLVGPAAFQSTARFGHAVMFTCPGHATLSTGAAPSTHGIVGNRWMVDGEKVYCASHELLLAETLADRIVGAGGHVASLGVKDRGAVMLGGHSPGLVGYFDLDALRFTGAPWLEAFDLAPYKGKPWEARRADAYAQRGPDDQLHESDAYGPRTFPKPPPTEDPDRHWLLTPLAGTALTDIAIEALERSELGRDDTPDLLAVTYAHTDYIGHVYTTESWEALDALLRLDEDLSRLFATLDARVGTDGWTVALSSDHGSAPAGWTPLPESFVSSTADAVLAHAGFEETSLFDEPSLHLPATVKPPAKVEIEKAVAAAVESVDGVARAVRWADPDALAAAGPLAEAVRQSVHPGRSGAIYVIIDEDVQVVSDPDDRTGTGHGTPYDFDARVPWLMAGHGVRAGAHADDVDARQIAPTLGALLGVGPPAQAELGSLEAALAR